MSRRRGKQRGAGGDELSLDLPILKPIERAPGDHQQIDFRRNPVLVQTEYLAHSPLGPVALNGTTDGGPGSDHRDPRALERLSCRNLRGLFG